MLLIISFGYLWQNKKKYVENLYPDMLFTLWMKSHYCIILILHTRHSNIGKLYKYLANWEPTMRKEDLNCSEMLVLHVDANAFWPLFLRKLTRD